jgi:phosphate transport system substrate-binding protein
MKKVVLTLLVLALASTVTGCGQTVSGQAVSAGAQAVSVEDQLQGTITVSGAWALYPLMVRWGEEFQKLHPDVRFDISAGGAGKGIADALANAVDIGMVSREIYPQEIDKGAFWVSVTKDAVFATVSVTNPVMEDLLERGISQETFIGIFITGEITTWGQVIEQPDITDPIHVYTRSDACGAAATWASFLGSTQEDLLGIAVYGDPGLLDAVIKDPLGIGYNNLNYAYDMETGQPVAGAQVVPLDENNDGRIGPDESCVNKAEAIDAVAEGRYPSPPARDLNLVTKGQPEELVLAFLTWVLTDGQNYVGEAGYIPLPQKRLNEELRKLD